MKVTTVDKENGEVNKFKVINKNGKLRVVWFAKLKSASKFTSFKNVDFYINSSNKERRFK